MDDLIIMYQGGTKRITHHKKVLPVLSGFTSIIVFGAFACFPGVRTYYHQVGIALANR